jgi:hypothetical protein
VTKKNNEIEKALPICFFYQAQALNLLDEVPPKFNLFFCNESISIALSLQKKKTIKAPQNAPKEKLAWKVDCPPSTPNTT